MNNKTQHLQLAIKNICKQICDVLSNLSNDDYARPSDLLFNASIGQHVRHVIELFIELEKGYQSGFVNYEKRKRDHQIESDRHLAISLLNDIAVSILKEDKRLITEADFVNDDNPIQMNTSYYRELAYNIEHSIHHMALIRIGVNELSSIPVEENFGIAPATVKYRKQCVQ